MHDFLLACIHLDPLAIVQSGSYLGIAGIVFAESGLLIGIFLPGDSLLFTAGLLSAGGFLNPPALAVCVALAAILGDSTGYWFGARIGADLFKRKDSRFFKREYLRRTQRFFEQYGARALILARFMPIVRTIAPVLAGAGVMPYRKFLAYNALGGILWGIGMVSLGYSLGSIIPNIDTYILPLSLAIVVISFLPILANLIRTKR